jgi:hypothetical protein
VNDARHVPENRGELPENIAGCARLVRMQERVWCGSLYVRLSWETVRGVTADRWSCPTPWMPIIPRNRDIRSHMSDRESTSPLRFLGWLGAWMSPFYTLRRQ